MFRQLLEYLKAANKELREFNEGSKKIAEVEVSLTNVRKQAEEITKMFNTMKDLIAGINAEGDRLAAFIAEIMEKVHAGMTVEEEIEIKGMLETAKTRLSTIGADPTDPIPPVEPPVEPPPVEPPSESPRRR